MATKQVICDTDVIIDYWDARSPRHSITKNILDTEIGIDNVLISIITQIELLVGAFNKAELSNINKSFTRFGILSIDDGTGKAAVELINKYNLSHGLALADAFIASTAIQSESELFTYNVKDYKFIDGVQLYKPEIF